MVRRLDVGGKLGVVHRRGMESKIAENDGLGGRRGAHDPQRLRD
jgi:hypothetical protein